MHFLKNACILVILEGKCWMHFGCMCIHVHVEMHVGANFQHASACIFAESQFCKILQKVLIAPKFLAAGDRTDLNI